MKENQLTLILIAGLVIVCALFAFNNGMPDTLTIAQNEQRETITVSESIELESMPDEAEVYIDIETQEETASEAKDLNAELSDAVMEALDDYGIDAENIETTSYYIDEQRKWDSDEGEYIYTGYRVRHTIRVTTDDITAAGDIIDLAIDAGATGINSINFGLSDEAERELKAKALAEAAQKAEEKAQSIVDAVGVDLGDFVSISESSYYSPYYARSYASMAMMDSEESYDTAILPEEVSVSGTVTLTYEIVQ
jgi:uncharacterized protein